MENIANCNKECLVQNNDEKIIVNSVLNKKIRIEKMAFVQIVFCIIFVGIMLIYNIFDNSFVKKVIDKYGFIATYNATYEQSYNKIAQYINNKFNYNIPLKNGEKVMVDNNEIVLEANNEIIDNNQVEIKMTDNQYEQIAEEVSSGYNETLELVQMIKQEYSFIVPVKGLVSSRFGNRETNDARVSSFHVGIDIANDIGTNIYASLAGKVEEVSYTSVYGNYIMISNNDVITLYAHCNKIVAKVGSNIAQGEKIAEIGNTGYSTGPHLHFEIRKNGRIINPEYLINI